MPRPIWRGTISFGLVTIPVGLYPAVARNELSFHLLDRRDLSPIHNQRVSERTGEIVPWEEVTKGYELEDGRWVTLSDEDFEAANVKATQTIDVISAVDRADVPPEYFETPYYLAPEKAGFKAYALLREALKRAGRVAVGQIVIRTRQRLVLLVPEGRLLLLEVIHYPHELRASDNLEVPAEDLAEESVTDAELELAEQLVGTIASDWDPSEYHDTYRDDLLALIERKAAGEAIEAPAAAAEVPAPVVDIMDLLKQSVADARESRAGSA
jgi:DNA end-binding protein Ku